MKLTKKRLDLATIQNIQIPHQRERSVGSAGRKALPENLPHEPRTYEASACPCCNASALHLIGEVATEQVTTIEPAKFKVLCHLRKTYRCKSCEKVFTAAGPKYLIEKSSYASAEFLAYVACGTYQYGLSFYRQEAILNQAGVPTNRTTLANLMSGVADKLIALHLVLWEILLAQNVVHANETQILKESGRKATKSPIWLYRSCDAEPHRISLFDYPQDQHNGCWVPNNNIAELGIKAKVIGRKNLLAVTNPCGAHTDAIMHSVVETAKANGIDPFEYLRYIIETMPQLKTAAELHRLLPWNMPRLAINDDRLAA